MDTFNQNIGKKIRLYRKAAGMSSTQLAAALGKSKATVSKYESGAISVDIQTLCTIAQILKIELPQLLDLPKVAKANPDNIKQDQYYIYFYDGRVKRLTRNYLQITSDPTGKADATFYADLPDFTDLSACRSLYYGEGIFTDMSESFLLENQSNRIEYLYIVTIRPQDRLSCVPGLISGISSMKFFGPVSFKCLLSKEPLNEDEGLKQKLLLTKDEIKRFKTSNMFILDV